MKQIKVFVVMVLLSVIVVSCTAQRGSWYPPIKGGGPCRTNSGFIGYGSSVK